MFSRKEIGLVTKFGGIKRRTWTFRILGRIPHIIDMSRPAALRRRIGICLLDTRPWQLGERWMDDSGMCSQI